MEKGKAAKRQIRTIADRRRGAVFVVARKYTRLLYTVELYSSRDPKFGRLSIVS